jgi:hypothetical protein
MVLDQALNRLLAYMQCIAPIYTNCFCIYVRNISILQGRIQAFKLGGAHLKKLRQAEGGTKHFGVFRVKNHDFTPKNHIFSNFRGGARTGCAPPPVLYKHTTLLSCYSSFDIINNMGCRGSWIYNYTCNS